MNQAGRKWEKWRQLSQPQLQALPEFPMAFIHKCCPSIHPLLWRILKVIWQRGRVANQWRFAEGVWIPPKKKTPEREINLGVFFCWILKGKIFSSILSWWMSKIPLKNNYVDTSVQKGRIPGFVRCLKYTGVVTQILREARESRGDLAVLWLDLVNAYSSIPHKLVEEALKRHHVPGKNQQINPGLL